MEMTQEQWNEKNRQIEEAKKAKSSEYESAKKTVSELQQKLDKQQSIANSAQEKINQLVKQGAPEDQIKAEQKKRDDALNEINKKGGLKDQTDNAKDIESKTKKNLDKTNKEYEEHQKNNPQKIQEEKDKKEKEKKESNTKKIKENIDKIDNPAENIHKTVCLKAGILPSTPYAINFCKWLKENSFDENGDCIWYKLDEKNNRDIDGKALKKLKKIWTFERAGKNGKKQEKATNESDTADTINDEDRQTISDEEELTEQDIQDLKEADEAEKNYGANQEKIDELEKANAALEAELKALTGQTNNATSSDDPYATTPEQELQLAKESVEYYEKHIKKWEETIAKEEPQRKENIATWKQKIEQLEREIDSLHDDYALFITEGATEAAQDVLKDIHLKENQIEDLNDYIKDKEKEIAHDRNYVENCKRSLEKEKQKVLDLEKNSPTSNSDNKEKIEEIKKKIEENNKKISELKNESKDLKQKSDKATRKAQKAKAKEDRKKAREQRRKDRKENKEQRKIDKENEKIQKAKEKEISKWAKYLKSTRQKYFDEAHKKYGSEIVDVIPDEISTEGDLKLLAEYAYNHPIEIGLPEATEFDTLKKSYKSELESACTTVWNKKNSILSIKNDMPEETQKASEDPKLNPNATAAFFKGELSNTFALANKGIQLATNPAIAMQMAKLCTDATMAATTKLTTRVNEKLVESTAQILDVSEIMTIPVTAANDMLSKIMTPDQIMKKIMDDMNDDKLVEVDNSVIENKINTVKENVTQKVASIQNSVGNKLAAFNDNVSKVVNTINQGPTWYIEKINSLEVRAEKEIIKQIDNITVATLNGKQQFVDTLVNQISYNLVAPINRALEVVQIEIIRKVIWLANKAKAVAKAAAAKAIMKILGLLGA